MQLFSQEIKLGSAIGLFLKVGEFLEPENGLL